MRLVPIFPTGLSDLPGAVYYSLAARHDNPGDTNGDAKRVAAELKALPAGRRFLFLHNNDHLLKGLDARKVLLDGLIDETNDPTHGYFMELRLAIGGDWWVDGVFLNPENISALSTACFDLLRTADRATRANLPEYLRWIGPEQLDRMDKEWKRDMIASLVAMYCNDIYAGYFSFQRDGAFARSKCSYSFGGMSGLDPCWPVYDANGHNQTGWPIGNAAPQCYLSCADNLFQTLQVQQQDRLFLGMALAVEGVTSAKSNGQTVCPVVNHWRLGTGDASQRVSMAQWQEQMRHFKARGVQTCYLFNPGPDKDATGKAGCLDAAGQFISIETQVRETTSALGVVNREPIQPAQVTAPYDFASARLATGAYVTTEEAFVGMAAINPPPT